MREMKKILVTGANGFVGRALCREAMVRGMVVVGATRARLESSNEAHGYIVDRIDGGTDWEKAFIDCDVVVHLAARVHVMHDTVIDPSAAFQTVNVEGTVNLARQAAAAGTRRFVFMSSVKVNGEATLPGQSFTADSALAPMDPYAISKMEAEQGLREIAVQTGMEVVIIRPPLVYGPGVKANFQKMMRWLARGVPLPLGAIHNRRSLVALDNLVDLIVICVEHPTAANQTFLVSDGEDLSTTQLLQRMGQALGKPARLIPVPPGLIRLGAALVGKSAVAQRLCDSLQVDISKTRQLLGWSPPLSVDEGLKKAADGFAA